MIERLQCTVRDYDWGDPLFIADLQGRAPDGTPEAELWMGAHPGAPSVVASSGRRLDEVIADDAAQVLGAEVAERFGSLPFLMKILAAAEPLSIQAHPSLEQARSGFARENDLGIALDAPTRVYRDANHKPELICALTPFEAKCGFRDLDATRELIATLAGGVVSGELDELRARVDAEGPAGDVLAATLAWLLRSTPAEAAHLVAAVAAGCADIVDGPHAPAARWAEQMAVSHSHDPGVVVALLLNHVVLAPGEAVFLGAGNLHAYLRGAGVEIMANSDNVVRGGLTTKHIDVEELLRVVDCTPIDAPVQRPAAAVHTYDAPVPEFALTRLAGGGAESGGSTVGDSGPAGADSGPDAVTLAGPAIVVVTDGSVQLRSGEGAGADVALAVGEVAWSPAGPPLSIAGPGEAFVATVPR
ncbi:MAG: mannose-6-phosphate isomerase, class I [Acidimicrobiales bacterium]